MIKATSSAPVDTAAGHPLSVPEQQACIQAFSEEVLNISCGSDQLFGILSWPQTPADPVQAVLIMVGGPQYRVGSHRQFVQLSRTLAIAGFPCLRFDVRGMGDSPGEALPRFEDLDRDTEAALKALQQRLPSLKGVALWGLCDGASAALLYSQRQPNAFVNGLCLANPWVRSATTQAQTTVKHYYRDRLRQPAFWLKLLKGGVALKAASDLLKNLRQARDGLRKTPASGTSSSHQPMPFQQRMALGWRSFQGPILLLTSENDYTAKEFLQVVASDAAWASALAKPGVTRVELQGTDHTCSDTPGRERLEAATVHWLQHQLLSKPPTAKSPATSPA